MLADLKDGADAIMRMRSIPRSEGMMLWKARRQLSVDLRIDLVTPGVLLRLL
jgi:hypothetical protein